MRRLRRFWRCVRWWADPRYLWWLTKRTVSMARADYSTSDGDWSTIGDPMLHAIRRVRLHMSTHRIVQNWERDCRQMLIAETLLSRLLADDYYTLAVSEFTPYGSSR